MRNDSAGPIRNQGVDPCLVARIGRYLALSRLNEHPECPSPEDIHTAVLTLAGTVSVVRSIASKAVEPAQLRPGLFTYSVPMLDADGKCSKHGTIAPEPYDLGAVIGGPTLENARWLFLLDSLIEQVAGSIRCAWLGIYKRFRLIKGPYLVKLCYRGIESRAEFPLTAQFAPYSNNSTVGLNGRAVIITDVDKHVECGGVYYECDVQVQSEACLPIFDNLGYVIGIIDAEDGRRNFFQREQLAQLISLCILLPELLG